MEEVKKGRKKRRERERERESESESVRVQSSKQKRLRTETPRLSSDSAGSWFTHSPERRESLIVHERANGKFEEVASKKCDRRSSV